MQRISIRLLAALVTFGIGVAFAAVWVASPWPQIDSVPVLELTDTVSQSICFPGLGVKTDQLTRLEGDYFPPKPFKQLKEPSLRTGEQTAYRLLWLRSFHSKIAVRLWLDGEKKMITVKELGRDNQGDTNTLVVDQTRTLTPAEWTTFTRLLGETCFWTMPTSSEGPIANDGAWWVFEGVREGYYHTAYRQSPDSGSFRALCLYVLKLSGLPLDASKGEIY